jgi:CRP-like cAMP-binding protein
MGKHSLAAQAITDVRVRIVKKQTLSALVLSDCKVADRLLSLTARELARKQSLALLLSRAAHERIEWSHDSPSGHQAKADRAPRFRQCLIIAPRSSTRRVQLHWRLGQGADHGPHGARRGGLG